MLILNAMMLAKWPFQQKMLLISHHQNSLKIIQMAQTVRGISWVVMIQELSFLLKDMRQKGKQGYEGVRLQPHIANEVHRYSSMQGFKVFQFEYGIFFVFSHDFLKIYDGTQLVAVETGEILQSVIRSSESDMTINFQSDHIGTRKGFKIKVHFFLSGKYNLKLKNIQRHNSKVRVKMESIRRSCTHNSS